jgi:hypothetical protein
VADKYVVMGAKKMFSLTRTKLRLAEESETVEARPAPLPLVKLFAQVELNTVAECRQHWQKMKADVDYRDDGSVATTVLQLCDLIECVKYKFEPKEYMPLFGAEGFKEMETECRLAKEPLNILLMTAEGLQNSVYFGENPPLKVRHYSRVISGIAPLLHHLYSSDYFSNGIKLRNIFVCHGSRTLLGNAVEYALKVYLTDMS